MGILITAMAQMEQCSLVQDGNLSMEIGII